MIFAIVGSAPCYAEDLARLRNMCVNFATIALNDQIFNIQADMWMFLDHDSYYQRVAEARGNQRKDITVISPRKANGIDRTWSGDCYMSHGGSAMYAIKYVENVMRGASVLCGCPMDNSGKFDGSAGSHGDVLLPRLIEGLHTINARCIRSMGGNTANIFGIPDAGWLNEHC